MPIYEFVCASCDTEFEKILSFSAVVPPACPTCGGENVSRQMSRPAIHFKGSGWYITDSKNDSKGKASATGSAKQTKEGSDSGESSKGESSKSESSSEGSSAADKSESKPAQSAQAAD